MGARFDLVIMDGVNENEVIWPYVLNSGGLG